MSNAPNESAPAATGAETFNHYHDVIYCLLNANKSKPSGVGLRDALLAAHDVDASKGLLQARAHASFLAVLACEPTPGSQGVAHG